MCSLNKKNLTYHSTDGSTDGVGFELAIEPACYPIHLKQRIKGLFIIIIFIQVSGYILLKKKLSIRVGAL